MTNLKKYYTYGAVIPFAAITIIGIILGVIHNILGIGADYKSEWFTNDGYWQSVLLAIILSAFICVLSTSIFLNNLEQIKHRTIFSFISWFLPPCFFIGYMWTTQVEYLYLVNWNFDYEIVYVLSITLPHFIALIISFCKFRKDLKLISIGK